MEYKQVKTFSRSYVTAYNVIFLYCHGIALSMQPGVLNCQKISAFNCSMQYHQYYCFLDMSFPILNYKRCILAV